MDTKVINQNYSSLEEELIGFIKANPNNFQAKVLVCLDFLSISTFEQILGRLYENPEKILKSLILSEKNGLVVHINDGWILRKKPKADFLNNYLSLDIDSSEVSIGKKLKRLLKGLPPIKEFVSSCSQNNNNIEGNTEPQCISETYSSGSLYIYRNEELNPERPMTGGGRSRSKEYTDDDALTLNREVNNRIKSLNEERQKEKTQHAIANIPKPTKEQETAERIRAFLTINYPEYESLIDLRYKEDSTLQGMMQLFAEIKKTELLNELSL